MRECADVGKLELEGGPYIAESSATVKSGMKSEKITPGIFERHRAPDLRVQALRWSNETP
jgi:hypothetical protein